ncbi:GIN domain-containing protein [Sphingomonas qomolangmaensis]|uniref:DUF2807 domain-containing protein n=1 Tax=Sphingomonas qomolangmaensis TaxID=2918765 RepID=A0ABY5LEX1_9SPHN|nr:DUF2807 domain-containing protein [Sphingomonas qomolangmaensis]UUL84319.1 DUF2807 domain-containing protein [Sphingomonas qomolangmaensis]
MIRILLAAALLSTLPAPAHAEDRRVMVTGFDSIRVEGPFDVELRTGGATGATISGEARALDGVAVRVEDRVLVISANPNSWGGWPDARAATPRIVATAPAIRSATLVGNGRLAIDRMASQQVTIDMSGSGTLRVAAIAADEFRATLTGAGSLEVRGTTARARFASNGANRIDAASLAVRDLTVLSQSPSESSFSASETANITAVGLGQVTVSGKAACTVAGPGPVLCGNRTQ